MYNAPLPPGFEATSPIYPKTPTPSGTATTNKTVDLTEKGLNYPEKKDSVATVDPRLQVAVSSLVKDASGKEGDAKKDTSGVAASKVLESKLEEKKDPKSQP